MLDECVAAGTLIQEEADIIYNNLVENQLTCDGTGSDGIKMQNGAGFESANGLHDGTGQGMGKGSRMNSFMDNKNNHYKGVFIIVKQITQAINLALLVGLYYY